MLERCLVIVYTGKGKGKTTAALGIVLRAVGHGCKVVMIQFIKGEWYYGELTSSKRLEPEFEMIAAGRGFVGIIDDDHPIEDHQRAAKQAIAIAKQKIASGDRKSTRLNSSHANISYAVFCLKKKKKKRTILII